MRGIADFYDSDVDIDTISSWIQSQGLSFINTFTLEKKEAREKINARRRAAYALKGMQRQAEKVGLQAWAVLQDKSLNIADCKAAEDLFEKSGLLDAVFNRLTARDLVAMTSVSSTYGWRMRNGGEKWDKDLSFITGAEGVQLSKSAAGCAERLKLIWGYPTAGAMKVQLWKDFEHVSTSDLASCSQAGQWLAHAGLNSMQYAVSALIEIGKTPPALRWALVKKRAVSAGLRERILQIDAGMLDHEMVAAARINQALKLSLMSPVAQWEHLMGIPRINGVVVCGMAGFKVGVFKRLCAMLDVSLDAKAGKVSSIQPIFQLVRLFGDEQSIRRYVKDCGFEWTLKGLHDAGQFQLSVRKEWTAEKWAPLCLRHPGATKYAKEFGDLEAKNLFPTTLSGLRRAIAMMGYPEIEPGSEALAEMCINEELSGSVFTQYQKFWKTAVVKKAEFLPQVVVWGEELGLPKGWKFEKLAAADLRGPLLGQLTGCCQHLSGAGADCARNGVLSPFSAFYVVTHEGRVVAQSWAWLTTAQSVVFDSVECRNRAESELGPVLKLYAEAFKRLAVGKLGIKDVYLGDTDSGITPLVHKTVFDSAKKEPGMFSLTPVDPADYYDGDVHFHVAGPTKAKPRNLKYPVVEGFTPASRDSRRRQREEALERFRIPPFYGLEGLALGENNLVFDRELMQAAHAHYIEHMHEVEMFEA